MEDHDHAAGLDHHLEDKMLRSEQLCKRCGACCGAFDGDPCIYLKKDSGMTYHCQIYSNRLGKQKTVSGREFECVPIREVLSAGWPKNPQCSYVTSR